MTDNMRTRVIWVAGLPEWNGSRIFSKQEYSLTIVAINFPLNCTETFGNWFTYISRNTY